MSQASSSRPCSTQHLVDTLRDRLRRVEQTREKTDGGLISSGCRELDGLFPAGGLARGTLIECLGRGGAAIGGGGGAGMLALLLARQVVAAGGVLVVLDSDHSFYPPAAVAWGIAEEVLVVLRVSEPCEQLWALDQCLRCPAVAAVWAVWEPANGRDFRRLRLAAERGGGVGLLVRSDTQRNRPSWSDLQLVVHPDARAADQSGGRRLVVELARCRQGRGGGRLALEIDVGTGVMRAVSTGDEANDLPLVAELADPASGGGATRA